MIFKLKGNLRHRLNTALKSKSWQKNTYFSEYIGCERNELIQHLEFQFQQNMTWKNYGKLSGQWSIDHKIPLSSAKNEEEMYKLCHYSNLQPLWHDLNLLKSNKVKI